MRAAMPFSALQTRSNIFISDQTGLIPHSKPRLLAQLALVGAGPWRRLGPVRGAQALLARGTEGPDRRQSRADRGVQVNLCQPDRLGPNPPSGRRGPGEQKAITNDGDGLESRPMPAAMAVFSSFMHAEMPSFAIISLCSPCPCKHLAKPVVPPALRRSPDWPTPRSAPFESTCRPMTTLLNQFANLAQKRR
jgi:hypothetical protein